MSEFELWFYRAVIASLCVLVISLIKTVWSQRIKKDKDIESRDKTFLAAIEKLESAVNELRLLIGNINTGCHERHIAINGRLKLHEKQIADLEYQQKENDKDIAVLKNNME